MSDLKTIYCHNDGRALTTVTGVAPNVENAEWLTCTTCRYVVPMPGVTPTRAAASVVEELYGAYARQELA